MRVYDLVVGGRRGKIRLSVPDRGQPVQHDIFVAVRSNLDQIVRRWVAGSAEAQRHALVDTRRPTLEPQSQARITPPIGQHVHPVNAVATDQQRIGIVTTVVRTAGNVARVRFGGAADTTPSARRFSGRVPAVVGRRRRRTIRESVTLAGVRRLL